MVKRFRSIDSSLERLKASRLKKIIDDGAISVASDHKSERGFKSRSLYASDYGHCMKKIWYQFFPDKFLVHDYSPRLLRVFQNGDAVHERLSLYLKKHFGGLFQDEIDIPRDDLDVHGRCDGICFFDGEFVVVEFKSINKKTVGKPEDSHLGQLMWYLAMWIKRKKQLLSGEVSVESIFDSWLISSLVIRGELIYESKQNNETYQFEIPFDNNFYLKVRSWFEELNYYVNNKKVPNIKKYGVYGEKRFPCKWGRGLVSYKCPFWKVCYNK